MQLRSTPILQQLAHDNRALDAFGIAVAINHGGLRSCHLETDFGVLFNSSIRAGECGGVLECVCHLDHLGSSWGGDRSAWFFEPLWLLSFESEKTQLRNVLAPLANSTLCDFQNSGKLCSAPGEFNGVFSFHGAYFSTLNT